MEFVIIGIIVFVVVLGLKNIFQLLAVTFLFLTDPFPDYFEWYERLAGKGFMLLGFCCGIAAFIVIIFWAVSLIDGIGGSYTVNGQNFDLEEYLKEPFTENGSASLASIRFWSTVVASITGTMCIVIRICFKDAVEEARAVIGNIADNILK